MRSFWGTPNLYVVLSTLALPLVLSAPACVGGKAADDGGAAGAPQTGIGGVEGSGGGGGGGSSTPGGTTSSAPSTPACTDVPPDDKYTCEQQKGWGKCDEPWMQGHCEKTCGRCVDTGSGTTTTTTTGTTGGGSTDGSSCGLEPADKSASVKTRKLLCFLKQNKFISGQTDMKDAKHISDVTGKWPAIVAFDFMRYTRGGTGQVGDTSDTQGAINWWNGKHGMVAFQWHWVAPTDNPDYGGGYADPKFDISAAMSDTNSTAYKRLMSDIDVVASEIGKMQDAGVSVIFRPLHECNNNYMWWAKKGPGPYKALYQAMFKRMTVDHGLHNIVWVYNVMAAQNGDPKEWYVGDDYVDIVASDYFQSQQDLGTMSALGNGTKVPAVAETFSALNPDNAASWNYWVVWASKDWHSDTEQTIKTAMANGKTITLDKLPDITQW